MRTHRVGTITLGISLVIIGIVFLLQFFIPGLNYQVICSLWPVVFIILGLEILISNFKDKEGTFIYDKGSIFLSFVVMAFAMFMGLIGQMIIYIGKV